MPTDRARGWLSTYAVGMGTTTRHNTVAYGFSVSVTTTFGALSLVDGHLDVLDLFLFVVGAAAAFAIVNLAVTRGFSEEMSHEPILVVALGTSFAAVSVSAALGVAIGFSHLLSGWLAWLVVPFVSTIAYLFAVGLEMTIASFGHEHGAAGSSSRGRRRRRPARS